MKVYHSPVMVEDILKLIISNKSGIYFDGTIGFGGHAEHILNKLNNDALYVATDVDADAFNYSKEKFKNDSRVKLYNYNFSLIDKIAKIESIKFFDGIFADLGVSSFQLDNAESGFTFRQNAKLDLRLDKSLRTTAENVVNNFDERELAKIFFELGEEKNSKKIAKKICETRSEKHIKSTMQLADMIAEITPKNYLNKTLARVFQALRIYVNDELGALKTFIENSVGILRSGGIIVILSYHSLEDRIVKETFKYETLDCICPPEIPVCQCNKESRLKILTKKPILPSQLEIDANRRSRSAKLRAAVRK
jgi:16S rRNA (cytosine1402-N4)-methyltransferase